MKPIVTGKLSGNGSSITFSCSKSAFLVVDVAHSEGCFTTYAYSTGNSVNVYGLYDDYYNSNSHYKYGSVGSFSTSIFELDNEDVEGYYFYAIFEV